MLRMRPPVHHTTNTQSGTQNRAESLCNRRGKETSGKQSEGQGTGGPACSRGKHSAPCKPCTAESREGSEVRCLTPYPTPHHTHTYDEDCPSSVFDARLPSLYAVQCLGWIASADPLPSHEKTHTQSRLCSGHAPTSTLSWPLIRIKTRFCAWIHAQSRNACTCARTHFVHIA